MKLGTIDSESKSWIITTEQETLIAQLTMTALTDSPVDRAHIWLKAAPGPVVNPALAGHPAPLTGMRKGSDGR